MRSELSSGCDARYGAKDRTQLLIKMKKIIIRLNLLSELTKVCALLGLNSVRMSFYNGDCKHSMGRSVNDTYQGCVGKLVHRV